MFQKLRDKGVLNSNNIPYQKYINCGYFKVVEINTLAGIKLKTVVFQKGLDFIRKQLTQ